MKRYNWKYQPEKWIQKEGYLAWKGKSFGTKAWDLVRKINDHHLNQNLAELKRNFSKNLKLKSITKFKPEDQISFTQDVRKENILDNGFLCSSKKSEKRVNKMENYLARNQRIQYRAKYESDESSHH